MDVARGRRRLDTESRRQEIVEAALDVLSTRDAGQVPMAEIAERAGSSSALVYHYFGSKDQLAETALGTAADELIALMQVDTSGTVAEQLDAGLRIYLDFLTEHPASWSALLRAGADPSSPLAAVARRVDDHAATLALDALTAGSGADADQLVELAVRGWLELVKGSCLRWLTTGAPEPSVLHAFLAHAFYGCVEAAALAKT